MPKKKLPTLYRVTHGITLPDGSRVEAGEQVDTSDIADSVDWLLSCGAIVEVTD